MSTNKNKSGETETMKTNPFFKEDPTEWVSLFSNQLDPDGSPPGGLKNYWREWDIYNGLKIIKEKDRSEIRCSTHRKPGVSKLFYFRTPLGLMKRTYLHGHGDKKASRSLENRKPEDCSIGLEFVALPLDAIFPSDPKMKDIAIQETREFSQWHRIVKQLSNALFYDEIKINTFANTTFGKNANANLLRIQEKTAEEFVKEKGLNINTKKMKGFVLVRKIESDYGEEFENKVKENFLTGAREQPVPWDKEIDTDMSEKEIDEEKKKERKKIRDIFDSKDKNQMTVYDEQEIGSHAADLRRLERHFWADRRLYIKVDIPPEKEEELKEKEGEYHISGCEYRPAKIYMPQKQYNKKTGALEFPMKQVDITPERYGEEIVTDGSIGQIDLVGRIVNGEKSYGYGVALSSVLAYYIRPQRQLEEEVIQPPSHAAQFYLKQAMLENGANNESNDEEENFKKRSMDTSGEEDDERPQKKIKNALPETKKRPTNVKIPDDVHEEDERELSNIRAPRRLKNNRRTKR